MVDGTILLEARLGAVGIFESVFHPACQCFQVGIFVWSVLQHQQGSHPSHKGCIECIYVHPVFLGRSLYFTYSAEPLHSHLNLIGNPGFGKHIFHYDVRGVEIPHTVAQMMNGTKTASGLKPLIQKVFCHKNIHSCNLCTFFIRIATEPGFRYGQEVVVVLPEQLTVFLEGS